MQLQIKKQFIESVDLVLPCFFKDTTGESVTYVGVLNEDTYVRLCDFQSATVITNSRVRDQLSNLATEVNWPPITEDEFFDAWKRLYNNINLMPVADARFT